MLATPPEFDQSLIIQQILLINGVISVEGIQCWALTQKDLVASVQLTCSVSAPIQIMVIVEEAQKVLQTNGVSESTIQTMIQL